ncbi:uncharacterized protein LOC135372321 [Ornithodoros turicata]|uniref:uncharacterized protein LOC135372321 n=1 Tax=Ornithodoros turicata TaxID=34597 RepID=UPI0031392499
MRARTQIAALHFNENADREYAYGKDGQQMFRRKLLKTKKGAEVVSTVKTKATYNYVANLLKGAVTVWESTTYSAMVAAHQSPKPAAMTAAYPRESEEVLIARRMLRFPTE